MVWVRFEEAFNQMTFDQKQTLIHFFSGLTLNELIMLSIDGLCWKMAQPMRAMWINEKQLWDR